VTIQVELESSKVVDLRKKYFVLEYPIETNPRHWNRLRIEIWMCIPDNSWDTPDGSGFVKIGEYLRNYDSLYNTFTPFEQKGQEYALYSPNYSATRVMTLPNCKDIGGEEPHAGGFCPVDYFVPYNDPARGLDGTFGFIAGCIWGDDSTWKIQYLDLSRINEGIFTREAKFGYVSLPRELNLEKAIDLEDFWDGALPWVKADGTKETHMLEERIVKISTSHWFELNRKAKGSCCGHACKCECLECKDKRKEQE